MKQLIILFSKLQLQVNSAVLLNPVNIRILLGTVGRIHCF